MATEAPIISAIDDIETNMNSDQQNLKSDIGQTQATFGKALDSLVSEIGRCPEVLGLFPSHIREDVLRLQLALDPPWRGGIYDIQLFERWVRLSEKLLLAFNNYWEEHQSSDGQRLLMCRLYFLHELHH